MKPAGQKYGKNVRPCNSLNISNKDGKKKRIRSISNRYVYKVEFWGTEEESLLHE